MPDKKPSRCCIYARISVASEKSVSIARQIAKAKQYAASRDWEVVGVHRDEGISATKNRPEERAGWQALLASPEPFDVVLVWKIDRLTRKTLDFLQVNEVLQERGAGIVAVEQPIDMTTATGRAFATMLAVFAQMEAEAISDRVAGARSYLLRAGRVVGGKVPYGWKSVPNPRGNGLIWVQDDECIGYVRGMVDRTLAGHSIYSTGCWLDEQGAPTPTGKSATWPYSTVERILRHPVLAGLTPYNPGNGTKVRGGDVVRDAEGLPLVTPGLGIMEVSQWRAMLAKLDEDSAPQRKPRAMRTETSGLLSGLVFCGEHDEPVRMWRGTAQKRHGYYCHTCHQLLTNFEDAVVDEFLRQKGEHVRWSVVKEVHEGGSERLPEIEYRINEVGSRAANARDPEDRNRLQAELTRLWALQDDARDEPATVRYVPVRHTQTFGEDWADAGDDVVARRAVLDDALERVTIRRGRPGRRTRTGLLERMTFAWKMPDVLGPIDTPDDETLAAWAEDNPVPTRRTKR